MEEAPPPVEEEDEEEEEDESESNMGWERYSSAVMEVRCCFRLEEGLEGPPPPMSNLE